MADAVRRFKPLFILRQVSAVNEWKMKMRSRTLEVYTNAVNVTVFASVQLDFIHIAVFRLNIQKQRCKVNKKCP